MERAVGCVSVILNLFQDPLMGTVRQKKFRTKFGMTEGIEACVVRL